MPRVSSSVMKYFRVRVDGENDEPLITFCKANCEKYILVHHLLPDGNPHYHFYAETKYSQGNFSNKIKQELKVTGSDYCNQTCDPDRRLEYYSYLFNTKKGNVSKLISSEGFSIIDLATYRENAQQVAKEFTERMSRAKLTQYDVVMRVIETYPKGQTFTPDLIYDSLISVLKTCKMMARPYHIRDMIASVMAYSGCRIAKETTKNLTLKYFNC